MEFEWSLEKAKVNSNKHGIDFTEAMTVFNDPQALTFHDPDHSNEEDRFLVFGFSNRNRLLTVAYTYRVNNIRLISARRSTAQEKEIYGEL